MALLSPRLWGIAALLAALVFSHLFAYRKGTAHVRTEWLAATAEANTEARRMEQKRQGAVDAAAVAATKRRGAVLADSRGAADALERLRHAISTRDLAEESAAAAAKRTDTLGELLQSCGREYQELARKADGHVTDVIQLLTAWPE
jgi:hypothetical protein